MKKTLFTVLCAALLMSCASKRAGMVEPAIKEAKVLQQLAKANGLDVPDGNELIASAEKQSEAGQTEDAYLSADEAILQFQVSLLERENKNMEDSLKVVTENLNKYRSELEERRKTRR